MFNNDFINCVRSEKIYQSHIDVQSNLYDFIKYSWNHPKNYIKWEDNIKRIMLTKLENRTSTPKFIRNIINEMIKVFNENPITCHSFIGLTDDNKSFNIHKDIMDVIYLQAVGEVVFSIWDSEHDDPIITKDQGNLVYKKDFKPGDWIWIPRGTYHLIEPIGARVGISLGVEGNINPSTYV